jgi:hypothetical protein
MTKANLNKALETFVDYNKITVRVEGWVKRKEKIESEGDLGIDIDVSLN